MNVNFFGWNDRRDFQRRRKHHGHRHHHPLGGLFIWLVTNNHAVELEPERTIHMADTLHLAQIGNLSIVADDSKLNVVSFTPDPVVAPATNPTWTNSNPAAATLVASVDGLTAVLTPVAIGVTTVGVSVVIGGVTFSASDDISIVGGAVASVSIVLTPAPAVTPPPPPPPPPTTTSTTSTTVTTAPPAPAGTTVTGAKILGG
jgi:hypothetical protein